MPPIYADNYSGIGQLLAQDDERRMRSYANAVAGFSNAMQDLGGVRERGQTRTDRLAENTLSNERNARLDEQNRLWQEFQMGAGSRMNQLPASIQAGQFQMGTDRANLGVFGNQNDVLKEFPGMHPDLAAALASQSMTARPGISRQYDRELDVANAENVRGSAKKRVEEADKAKQLAWQKNILNGFNLRRMLSYLTGLGGLPEDEMAMEAKANMDRVTRNYPKPSNDILNTYAEQDYRGRFNPNMNVAEMPWLAEQMAQRGTGSPPSPRGYAPPMTRQVTNAPPAATNAPRMSAQFYETVNRLIAEGMNPVEAKSEAMSQFSR